MATQHRPVSYDAVGVLNVPLLPYFSLFHLIYSRVTISMMLAMTAAGL